MAKYLLKLLPFVFFFVSCEKSEIDSNYPTTFNKLSAERLSQERTTFSSINKYLTTTLNDYGFCGYSGDPLIVESPPLQDIITQSQAIEIVKDFALKNASETGIKNPNDLTFNNISSNTGYDGSNGWSLKSSFQKVDTIEVMYSEIIFNIKNKEVTFCLGNWYPDIYVPKKFNINQDKAKILLINKTVSHTSFAGVKYYVTISAADLNMSTVGLKILPITSSDRIELRTCWQINIPGPVYYIIYVDVMTGDVVGQTPTIIS